MFLIFFSIFIFSGHTFQYELLQFIENSFNTLKKLFISFQTIEERIGGLYLMYAMFFKQPIKDFGRFRLTIDEWIQFKAFLCQIENNDRYEQARLIFWQLWICNAFRFVECDIDIGTIQSRTDYALKMFSFRRIKTKIKNEISEMKNESNGLLKSIDLLQMGYNEMKEHLAITFDECSGLTTSDMISKINEHIEKINDNFTERIIQKPKNKLKEHITKETNVSLMNSELSGSNESNDSDNGSGNETIGSRRSRLKHKALNKKVVPLKSNEKKMKLELSVEGKMDKSRNRSASACHLQEVKRRIEIDEKSGNIIIVNLPNRYARSKRISSAKKQIEDGE